MDDVELDPVRGVVRVGGEIFAAALLEAGQVEVAGRRLRRVSLAERELVIETVGNAPDAVDACARLVAQLATVGGDVATESARLASEAVALQLAGAAMSGSLTVTSLVARRSWGRDAAGVEAIEADRVADAVAGSLRGNETGDPPATGSGWTRITYGEGTDEPPESVRGPRGARDRRARALLARADASVPEDLARWLLAADPRDDQAAGVTPGSWSNAVAGSPQDTGPDTTTSAHRRSVQRDRWGAERWPVPAAAPPTGSSASPAGGSANPEVVLDPARAVAVSAPHTGDHPPPTGTGSWSPGSTTADPSSPRSGSRHVSQVRPRRASGRSDRRVARGDPATGRSHLGLPVRPVVGRPPEGSPFLDDDDQTGSVRARRGPGPGQSADRSSSTDVGPAPMGSPRTAGADVDVLAAALQRAADARGVPR